MNKYIDENQVKNLCRKFANLNKTEFFVAGLCAGLTSVQPDIILKFIEKGSKIHDEALKNKFYVNAANGNLGKAKENLCTGTNANKFSKTYSNASFNTCKLCKRQANDKDIEYLENCADLFHKECIKENIQNQIIDNQYPIKCPTCQAEVSSVFIKLKVGAEYYEKYSFSEISSAVDCIECPISGCKGVINFNVQKNKIRVECEKCKNPVCLYCGVKYHDGFTCDEFLCKRNAKCQYCKLVVMDITGHKKCKCSNVLCGKCSLPINMCNCVHKLGAL